jgi:hypothetical protein
MVRTTLKDVGTGLVTEGFGLAVAGMLDFGS